MLLRNYDQFNQFYNCELKRVETKLDSPKISGFFYKFSDQFSGICVVDKEIRLYNGIEFKKITSISTFDLQNSHFRIEFENKENWIFNFKHSEDDSLVTPFEYLDSASYNWGLFLKEILSSKERQTIFIEVNG